MSQIEQYQENTELSKTDLIKLLHRMEIALAEKWQCAEKVVKLEEDEKKYLQSPEEYKKSSKKSAIALYIAVIVIAALTALVKNISKGDGIIAFFCTPISYVGIIMVAIGIIVAIRMTFSMKTDVKKYTQERSNFLADFNEAKKQFEECGKKCDKAISLISYFCPKECYEPRMLRKYISFFEEGRADTIKEARNLFDEWMHRERMEKKADAQYAATQNAIAAAYAAKNAAEAAEYSAEMAALYSRYNK